MDDDKSPASRVVAQISRYLDRNPGAADSLEGIAQWWLAGTRRQPSNAVLEDALDQLVRQHDLERLRGPDGRTLYRMHRARQRR